MNKICLIKPETNEPAYKIAADSFASLWKQITGNSIKVLTDADQLPAEQDIVILGSDSVNFEAHQMIDEKVIDGFDIRYGSDDYQLLSLKQNKRNILFIAGACGRSTIYAVYDFFQRQAGVRYFWDGDLIPSLNKIDLSHINVVEKPRFEYRGIRYFAHRGLHRFQAEHWNFEDWEREIDWIMKKRLNLFMLRIGLDDLFQKAFSDIVAYPPKDKVDPEALPRSYNDRTCFWSLEERGILRKKVLQYAFERGLTHPEDVGTITHWYSRTPKALLKSENITFTNQNSNSYNDPSGLVWNINDPKSWERYWKLTETHIREYGQPEIFHTIGLAERSYGSDGKENFNIKSGTLTKINQMLREHYPNAPLMIASWDFMSTWKSHEVRELVKKLDPQKTIILDYTADVYDPKENIFTNWDIIGKFPWIFGIFQGLEPNTDLRGDFELIGKRLKLALDDTACKGMVYWSEFAHGDAFMLEYFASNAWNAAQMNLSERIKTFCFDRYPEDISQSMCKIWDITLKISQTRNWTRNEEYPLREIDGLIFFNTLTNPWMTKVNADVVDAVEYHKQTLEYILDTAPELFTQLPGMIEQHYDNEFIRRDIVDIARITLSRVLHALFLKLSLKLEQWRSFKCSNEEIEQQIDLCGDCLEILGQVLFQHEDFSLYDSLVRLEASAPINPHSEQTLKGNTENGYCRSFYAEFFPLIYLPEFNLYRNWIKGKLYSNDRSEWILGDKLKEDQEQIRDNFYELPLKKVSSPKKSLKQLQSTLKHLSYMSLENVILTP